MRVKSEKEAQLRRFAREAEAAGRPIYASSNPFVRLSPLPRSERRSAGAPPKPRRKAASASARSAAADAMAEERQRARVRVRRKAARKAAGNKIDGLMPSFLPQARAKRALLQKSSR